MSTKKLVTCPSCGKTFDISYSRAFSCAGCSSILNCAYIKCPHCGREFPR